MSKAAEYRNRTKKTASLTLPSGAVFTVQRPPIEVWMMAGKVPQHFVRQLLDASTSGSLADLTPDDTMAALVFLRDAVLYAVVEPKLEIGAGPDSDALDPADLDPADFEFLTKWIMSLSPGVPVATKGGEVAVDDLTKFRQTRSAGAVDTVPDGAEIRPATEPIAGAA